MVHYCECISYFSQHCNTTGILIQCPLIPICICLIHCRDSSLYMILHVRLTFEDVTNHPSACHSLAQSPGLDSSLESPCVSRQLQLTCSMFLTPLEILESAPIAEYITVRFIQHRVLQAAQFKGKGLHMRKIFQHVGPLRRDMRRHRASFKERATKIEVNCPCIPTLEKML